MTRKLGQAQRRIKKREQRTRKQRHQFGYMPTARGVRVTDVDYLAGGDFCPLTDSMKAAYGYDGDDE